MVIITCFYHDINDTLKYCPTLRGMLVYHYELGSWSIIMNWDTDPPLGTGMLVHHTGMLVPYYELGRQSSIKLVCHYEVGCWSIINWDIGPLLWTNMNYVGYWP